MTTISLSVAALLLTGASTPVFVTSRPNGGWSEGGYYVHNNMWNSAMQMIDVHLPTTDGREVILTRYTQPEADQWLLLDNLKLQSP